MSKGLFSKLVGGISVFANEMVEKGFGAERLEKASLNEIKEMLDKANIEKTNIQATYNIKQSDVDSIGQQIKELEAIRDSNGAQFKATGDEKYKTKAMKVIDMMSKTQAEQDTASQELAEQKAQLNKLNEVIANLQKVYDERQQQHETAASTVKIAQSTSRVADLIDEISDYTGGAGNSKFAEQARHQQEVARLKVESATSPKEGSVDDFIKQEKANKSPTAAEDEFNALFGDNK